MIDVTLRVPTLAMDIAHILVAVGALGLGLFVAVIAAIPLLRGNAAVATHVLARVFDSFVVMYVVLHAGVLGK